MTKKKILSKQDESDIENADGRDQFFRTFDLGLSAALISVGFSLVSLDRENLHKVQFVFRRRDDMDRAIDAHWSDQLDVRSRTYFDALKMLKNRLYSE